VRPNALQTGESGVGMAHSSLVLCLQVTVYDEHRADLRRGTKMTEESGKGPKSPEAQEAGRTAVSCIGRALRQRHACVRVLELLCAAQEC
jgi:hypothetical protein